jgi:hypothetical protein
MDALLNTLSPHDEYSVIPPDHFLLYYFLLNFPHFVSQQRKFHSNFPHFSLFIFFLQLTEQKAVYYALIPRLNFFLFG